MMKGGATDTQSLDSLVESCDLSLKKHSPVGILSGGQMRKVQMLCMLAGGSSICLMDEVTTGMVSTPRIDASLTNKYRILSLEEQCGTLSSPNVRSEVLSSRLTSSTNAKF